jgi:glutamyl-tRNA reductase
MTDATLKRRKQSIPKAETIIDEVQHDFIQWLETRKFAPVIKALKKKLRSMKDEELDYHSKKLSDFNSDQAAVISDRIIQKITKQFANHLKETDTDADSSLELIQKVFQLEVETK